MLNIDKFTGVVVPVTALKSNHSLGFGDFYDLKLLANWVKLSKLNYIQILPINDTGTDSSPYMALSSCALHPIYLSLENLADYELIKQDVMELKARYEEHQPLYNQVLSDKLAIMHKLYDLKKETILKSTTLSKWRKTEPWVVEYALFSALKVKNNHKHWQEWDDYQTVAQDDLEKLFAQNKEACYFYIWLQHLLRAQLLDVKKTFKKHNIALKGDIPIMMNSDSADVWIHPELFDLNKVAGAPPDQFSQYGQRWGFPCYNWQAHQAQDFKWWKTRISYASNFFEAYRIDHVLGFFRIWAINASDDRAMLGYFLPYQSFTFDSLKSHGFSGERINWLSRPHITLNDAKNSFQDQYAAVLNEFFDPIANEELFVLKFTLVGDKAIFASNFNEHIKETLYRIYINRTFIQVDDSFYLSWHFRDTTAYQTLTNEEKNALEGLASTAMQESEALWEKQAYHFLKTLKEASSMMICAEDLGVLSPVVPKVLDELEILSLRVLRWSKNWQTNPPLWDNVAVYPYLSVATTSVHDSSTLRSWYENEENDKENLLKMLDITRELSNTPFKTLTALIFFKALFKNCQSKCLFIPLQDFFTLKEDFLELDQQKERINTPGTLNDANWHYRMKPFLEDLIADTDFALLIQQLGALRSDHDL